VTGEPSSPPGRRETIAERVAYRGYWAASWIARSLSERSARAAFAAGAGVAHAAMPRRRAVVEGNQAQVLGLERDDPLVRAAGREAFRLYARYWEESFRAPGMEAKDILARFHVEGDELIEAAMSNGRGCIAALPHTGNWDVAGRWVAERFGRIAAVAEDLRPARLSALFAEHRRSIGMRTVQLTPGGGVGPQLARLLADNWIVALVADRDLTGRGLEVDMFGRPRRVPSGPALLSITSGAPLLACSVHTLDRGWLCRVAALEFEPTGVLRDDVAELTRRLGAEFEVAIAANPPDWHVFQPGWDS
jgi:phosphatidylinositol dimannoside acyltransferase